MAEVKANLGTKLTDEEEKNADKSKASKLTPQPKAAVAGQDYMAVQICPYCGCVGYGDESPIAYRLYTCHCCGRTFRA